MEWWYVNDDGNTVRVFRNAKGKEECEFTVDELFMSGIYTENA